MRILVALVLVMSATGFAGTARATECETRSVSVGSGSKAAQKALIECLTDEIDTLRAQQAQMAKRMTDIEALLAEIPAPFINNNGRVSAVSGRPVERATFIEDARQTGGPSSRQINQKVLEVLCASRDCQLSMNVRVAEISGGASGQSFIDGPCRFSYDQRSGVWIRGAGCYGGALSGQDGNGVSSDTGHGAEVIMNAAGMCMLADTSVRDKVGTDNDMFERDHTKGLFLVASPNKERDGQLRYSCELVIE